MHPWTTPGSRRGSRVMGERAEGGCGPEMNHSLSLPGYGSEIKQEAGGSDRPAGETAATLSLCRRILRK